MEGLSMEKEQLSSAIFKLINEIRYQFYIVVFLFSIFIFKVIWPKKITILIKYLDKILPNFLKKAFYISFDELQAIILLASFLMVLSGVTFFCLSLLCKQNKIRFNYINVLVCTKSVEWLTITSANVVIVLFLINYINGMGFTESLELFHPLQTFLLLIYIIVPIVFFKYVEN
jgi:hypothetical protein